MCAHIRPLKGRETLRTASSETHACVVPKHRMMVTHVHIWQVRGGVEYSFMSTSTDRSVALRYATTSQGHGGTQGMIYEIRMGMVGCEHGARPLFR